MTAASHRIVAACSQSPQSVRCWVVCARPLLITVVCMCIIWKALCPYVLDARLRLWVSLEHAFTCASTTNQAERRSSATHLLAKSTKGLQPGDHVHKEAVHLLSLYPPSITSSGAFKPECNDLSQFTEDTGGPSMPVREFNLIACQSSWKTPFQTWIWTQAGESPQPVRPAGTLAYSVV